MLGWFPVRVSGSSMVPALREGDLLAVRRVRVGEPRPGQIVVARTGAREIVKRVDRVDGSDVWLLGDNPDASTDSRKTGAHPRSDVIGIVRCCYWPLTRLHRF